MYIERCPHDKENPYLQVNRELIRDKSISPACRWLIIYLLANKDGWRINAKQLVEYCKPYHGRVKVYSLLKEAMEGGYLKREEYLEKNMTRIRYFLSEFPKFKKCFRRAKNWHAEKGHSKEEPCSSILIPNASVPKNKKNPPPLTPPATPPIQPKKPPQKKDWRKRISSEWTDEEFEHAWKKLEKNAGRVWKIQGWLEATMQEYRNVQGLKSSQEDRIGKHRKEAMAFDGKKVNGDFISCKKDSVEISAGSFYREFKYDVSDEEWESLTERWFKNKS